MSEKLSSGSMAKRGRGIDSVSDWKTFWLLGKLRVCFMAGMNDVGFERGNTWGLA